MSVRRLAVLGLVLVASPGTVAAQSTDREVAAEVERLPPRLIEIRPDIQRNPELSNRETRTPPPSEAGPNEPTAPPQRGDPDVAAPAP